MLAASFSPAYTSNESYLQRTAWIVLVCSLMIWVGLRSHHIARRSRAVWGAVARYATEAGRHAVKPESFCRVVTALAVVVWLVFQVAITHRQREPRGLESVQPASK
ncbi:hypothetical protein BOTBODRAFT_377104 [Botryobasidium botryosum FD-172 SS1]|uniref:Uncharacterized protein n=1 Tax=Botryobasidium botryosum (strain FD-172 SS1) TaxID=930990 RepID=A0A067MVZ5_BOTB1|nr:hypothetical protein BOTBODRAFT_377104 [Botryobasidium botryosum FD-172 SS1]